MDVNVVTGEGLAPEKVWTTSLDQEGAMSGTQEAGLASGTAYMNPTGVSP